MGEKKVVSVEGLVCEHRGLQHDKHFVLTDDIRYVYPAYLLQWFVGKRVTIVIKEIEPEPDPK